MEQHIRILHVENGANWRDIINRRIGQRQGVVLDQASTVNEARQLIHRRHYDLIFADLDMSNDEDKPAISRDDFDRLMFNLGIDKGKSSLDERPPIVVLTGYQAEAEEIRRIINNYPGWIWGWLEKERLDSSTFDKLDVRLQDMIGELELHRSRSKRLVYGSVWPGGFFSLLSYFVGALIIWLAYQSTNNTALSLLISIIPLGLLIATQAYFLKMNRQLSDETYKSVILEVLRQVFSRRE